MAKFKFNILFFSFITLLFVNNSNALEYYHQIPFLQNDTVYYCFITDVFKEGGENYIKIIPLQYLRGLNAVIEAKKDGYAEYRIDNESKDTTWYVPNDFYIDDSNRAELKFRLSEEVKIKIWCDVFMITISTEELFNNSVYNRENFCYKYVYKRLEDNAFVLFIIAMENSKVTIIQQE